MIRGAPQVGGGLTVCSGPPNGNLESTNFVDMMSKCYMFDRSVEMNYWNRLITDNWCIINYLLTYLLTNSMVQSPSWEANWFTASQEIPRISRNPKVHYRTHKRPPTVSILGQPNPVHILTFHLLEIHPNIIHPFMPRFPQWSPSLRFPHQDPIHPPVLTHTHQIGAS